MAKVVANQVAHIATKGGMLTIKPGQMFDEKEDMVKASPGLFDTLAVWEASHEEVAHRAVEAATAAPGETRQVKKPAKPAAKPAAKKKVAAKR